jgi:predicted Rossmann-fold nucleotide-binding protein
MQAPDAELDAWLAAMPRASRLPFEVGPPGLYDICELYAGFDPARPESLASVFDARVYRWTREGGSDKPRTLTPGETIAARLHDTAMDRHVAEFLDPKNQVTVGFMGGHDISRAHGAFAAVARIARELRRRDFLIVTGGGPGLMEAANFGAFMAPFADEALAAALALLAAAPAYGPDASGAPGDKAAWLAAAARARALVLGRWDAPAPPAGASLGILTWYYGAEPPNLFAAAVGKYFFNSLREDGLVSVANGGLIFGQGAAGTVQEVFQSANLNFYREVDVNPTPMVFLDRAFWEGGSGAPGALPVFPLVAALGRRARSPFTDALLLTDSEGDIAQFIIRANADKLDRLRIADLRLAKV